MGTSTTGQGADPDPGGLGVALCRAGFVDEGTASLKRVVLDTFDGRLHDAGLRLEQRGNVLALSGRNAVTAEVAAVAVPRFASHLPAGPFRSRLADITDIRALLPLVTVTTRTSRWGRRNGAGKLVAAAQVHQRVVADHHSVDGWFVEVDDLTGYAKQGAELLELVRSVGVRPLDDGHDIIDLAYAAAGVDPAGQRSDPSVPLDPALPALEGFRVVLDNLLDAIEANRPGTIDDIDSEFLHELRVATRRTRSILRHANAVLPPDVLRWSGDGFRTLGQLTGPARDLDVYVLEWDTYVDGLTAEAVRALQPVHDQLEADRAAAHRELAAGLRSPATTELLGRWRTWLHDAVDIADAGEHAGRPVGEVVARRLHKAQDRLLDHGRAITPATPAEDVHELRKDAKKLRYLLECFGGLLPRRDRKAFVKHLKALQDNLGEHQDAEVHVARLRQMIDELAATAPPGTFVAIGQLIEQLEHRRQRARDTFAERFTDYDSKPTRQAFAAVLDGAAG